MPDTMPPPASLPVPAVGLAGAGESTLCPCPAAVLPWTISEALKALNEGERTRNALVDHA